MSANDRNAGYDAQIAAARAAAGLPEFDPEPELVNGLVALTAALHRLTLTLELDRLERMGYETGGVMPRRRLRMDAIRRELGVVP